MQQTLLQIMTTISDKKRFFLFPKNGESYLDPSSIID